MRNLARVTTFILAALFPLCFHIAGRAEVSRPAPPENRVLDSLSQRYEPVVFPHAMHLDIADNCSVCHHQHGHGTGVPACNRCHQLSPETFKQSLTLANMQPCRKCHPAALPLENPGLPTLQAAYHMQCLSCHAEADELQGNPKNCTEVCHERKKTAAR